MTEELTPFLLGIDHVGIAVPQLDVAIAFYRDILGLSVLHEEVNPEQGVREAMIGTAGHTQLQLLAPLDSTSPLARFLTQRGPGLQHLAYLVADIAAVTIILRARGLRLLYQRPRLGTHGRLINFISPRDTGGVLIELVQQAPAPTSDPPQNSQSPAARGAAGD